MATRRRPPPSPLLVVVMFIGLELLLTVVGIVALALLGRDVPEVLGTVCVGAMTGMTGLLAPNHGLAGGRSAHSAQMAGSAAAAAVLETDQLHQLQREADQLVRDMHAEDKHERDNA